MNANNSLELNDKDFKVLSEITSFIINCNKNNIISFSLNQLSFSINERIGVLCSPKQVKRYVNILEKCNLIVCVMKPLKNKRRFFIGKAKSVYVVSDHDSGKIKYNALDKARRLKNLDFFNKQIIGKLKVEEFISFFDFKLFRIPYLVKYIKNIATTVYRLNSNYSITNIIVYPGSLMNILKNLYNFEYFSKKQYVLT